MIFLFETGEEYTRERGISGSGDLGVGSDQGDNKAVVVVVAVIVVAVVLV